MANEWVTFVGQSYLIVDFSELQASCCSFLLASYLSWLKQPWGECRIQDLIRPFEIIHFQKNNARADSKVPLNVFQHVFWVIFRCHSCYRHELPPKEMRKNIQTPVLVFENHQHFFTSQCFQCHSSFRKCVNDCFPDQHVFLDWFSKLNAEKGKEQKQQKMDLIGTSIQANLNNKSKLVFSLPLPSIHMKTEFNHSVCFSTEKENGSLVFCDRCETYGCVHGLEEWRPKPVGLIQSMPGPKTNTIQTKTEPQTSKSNQTEDIETFGSIFVPLQEKTDVKLQEPNDLIWKTPFDSKQKEMIKALCTSMSLEKESQFILNGLVYFLRVESMDSPDPSSTIQSIVSTVLEPIEYYLLKSRVHRYHMFHSMMTWSVRNKMLENWKPLQHVFESILSICGAEKLINEKHVFEWFEWDKKQMPHRLAGRRIEAATWFCNEIGCQNFLQFLREQNQNINKRQKVEQKEEMSLIPIQIHKEKQSYPQLQPFLPFSRKRKRTESDDEEANVNCMQLKYLRMEEKEEVKTDVMDTYESEATEIQKYEFSSPSEKEDSEEDNAYALARRIKKLRRKRKRKPVLEEEEPDC